jgi:hypothetical protein
LGLVERPSRRAAHRAEASRRGLSPLGDRWAGLGERSKAVSEALRTVARHRPGKQAVERHSAVVERFLNVR